MIAPSSTHARLWRLVADVPIGYLERFLLVDIGPASPLYGPDWYMRGWELTR